MGTALGMAAVLLVSGAVLYALINRTLRAEFDDSLVARARSLIPFAESDHGRLEFELDEVSLAEFEPSDHAEYYQIWWPDGSVFTRSPSLDGADLDRVAGEVGVPVFRTVQLPDGRPGRVVGVAFVPRQEPEGGLEPGPGGSNGTPIELRLAVARDTVGLHATLATVRGLLIGVGVVAVFLSAGSLAWIVRHSLRPVDDLSRQIADVGESDLSTRIAVAGIPRELSPVVDRLNDLLVRLDAAFQRERRFTGDVAHELRTPLAGLRATLELALSREREPAAYQAALSDCRKISLQMHRMVENLLHLARVDAGQLEIRREAVDLAILVRDCWEPLAAKASARGLQVEWRLQTPGEVETDGEKLRLVVQNILDNAVTYADDKGHISLSTVAGNGVVVLRADNTGSRLLAGDVSHMFDRFWRGDASCGGINEGHCGLGLSLCKAIVGQLGGSIAGTSTAEGLFTITVRLPLADAGSGGGGSY